MPASKAVSDKANNWATYRKNPESAYLALSRKFWEPERTFQTEAIGDSGRIESLPGLGWPIKPT